MRSLCLINARGGSKGVPDKNIRPLAGRPLITWSIDVARAVPELSRIVVSTDSERIAGIARAAGAEIPFMRPAELATDTSVQLDTIHYTLGRLEEAGERYDAVVLLQPTCPLRSPEDVRRCIALMRREPEVDTVITVAPCRAGLPTALYRKGPDGSVAPLEPSARAGTLRQDLPPVYRRVGSVYAVRRDTIMKERALYGRLVKAVEIDEDRAFDIDTLFDWELIEAWVARQARKS